MRPVHLPPLGCMVTIVRVITSFSCDFVVRSLSGGIFYCQYCRLLQQPWRRLPCSGRLRRSQHSCRVVRVLIGPLPFSCTPSKIIGLLNQQTPRPLHRTAVEPLPECGMCRLSWKSAWVSRRRGGLQMILWPFSCVLQGSVCRHRFNGSGGLHWARPTHNSAMSTQALASRPGLTHSLRAKLGE